jgi:predicted RNase H-like HicB family nuclease
VQLLTVVESYVQAALERAEVEQLADGTIGAYVPECKGILAFGADAHECAVELYRLLEEWVIVSLANGNELPVIAAIDLNCDADSLLVTYSPERLAEARREVFEDETQFEEALKRRARSA